MKVDTVSPVNATNDNTGSARKLTDIAVVKGSNPENQQPQINNAVVKPNQLSPINNSSVKDPNSDDQQAQLNNQAKEKVDKALKIINPAFKDVNVQFSYSIDQRTNTEVVKIINSNTGEMIHQYPPQDFLNMLHRMYDMFGILMDKKA